MLDSIKKAKVGAVFSIVQEQDKLDPADFFSKLSNFGKKKHSLYFDFADFSIGTVSPALVLTGKDETFEIEALSESGKKLLQFIKKDFSFCQSAKYSKDKIVGVAPEIRLNASDEQRMQAKSHIDIIRTVSNKFKHAQEEHNEYAGIYGMIGHDFIDSIESVHALDNKEMPDYILYFVDNAFVLDKKLEQSFFISYAFVTDSKRDVLYKECQKTIQSYAKAAAKKGLKPKKLAQKKQSITYDTSDDEYGDIAREIKKKIVNGEIVQINPSRTVQATYNTEPSMLFDQIQKSGNPYTFFMNTESGIFIGAQPSPSISVFGEKEKTVSFSAISTTRPRGFVSGTIDSDLDSKRAMRIWADEQEMVKHIIEIDASRNSISHVCSAGSSNVRNMFAMRKLDQFQYLLSKVEGTLKPNLDALHVLQEMHCFSAGYPRLSAVRILRELEKSPRNFHGGSFVKLDLNKNMMALPLEPLHLTKDIASFRSNSSIIHSAYDSNDLQESYSQEERTLSFIKTSGGLK